MIIWSVVKIKQFFVFIWSVVKIKQFFVVILSVVKVKQFLVFIFGQWLKESFLSANNALTKNFLFNSHPHFIFCGVFVCPWSLGRP